MPDAVEAARQDVDQFCHPMAAISAGTGNTTWK